jgi:predicted secreted protein
MQEAFFLFYQEILSRLPDFTWAILIIFFGWIISNRIKALSIKFFDKLRLNQILKSLGWESFFDRFDAKMNVSKFFGILIEVYFFLLFLIISIDVLSLNVAGKIVSGVVEYYPNIFIAMIIFIATVFIADFSKKIVVGNLEKEKITYSNFLGDIISSGAWILAILAILYQLQIVQTLVLAIFIGVIALIVVSLGLAFGIGGKDMAKKLLEDMEKRVK